MSRSGTDLREVRSVTIKVTKFVEDIFPEYRPTVGAIYEADYTPRATMRGHWKGYSGNREFCIINVRDKRIILRSGEFEIIGA